MLSYTEKFDRIDTQKLISNDLYINEYQFFWENNKSKEVIVGFGAIHSIEIFDSSDLESIQSQIEQKLNNITDISNGPHILPKFFGGYAFDINSKLYNNWGKFPRGYFILPKCIITSNQYDTSITLIKKRDDDLNSDIISKEINNIYDSLINKPYLRGITNNGISIDDSNNNITKSDYLNIIDQIINEIKIGTIKKVVLSKSKYLKVKESINLSNIIEKLRVSYPECINFFIKIPKKGIFFGSTPERLIQKKGTLVTSEAIAGTIKRGKNINEDITLEHKLKNDLKNLEEHELVIQAIEKILKPILIDINISENPEILKLKNVQHLISNISGILKNNMHILELVNIMHPTPAVAGYPINEAIKLINKYEQHDRGWYSGPIGWVDSIGNGDFCVALRSALINKKSIQLFSGGGIVLNSDPDKEWEETELKIQTILEIIKEDGTDD